MKETLMTLKNVAERLDVEPYRIVYLFTSGRLPEVTMANGRRVFTEDDIEVIQKNLNERRSHGTEATSDQ